MPKSPKQATKRKRATLKKLSATTKEVTRKNMKAIGGKGLIPEPTANVTVGVAPSVTVGVAPSISAPKITFTK